MPRMPKGPGQRQVIPQMELTTSEIYNLAEVHALQDAFVLLFGAFMSEWSDEKFQEFTEGLLAPRPHGLEGVIPPALSGIVAEAFQNSRRGLVNRFADQRAMLIEYLARRLDA